MCPLPLRRRPRQAEAWSRRAEELARWAEDRLVARHDVYGSHYDDDAGKVARATAKGLTREHLVAHFAATETSDVIGLHVSRADETCRWLAVDVDRHDPSVSPDATRAFALLVEMRARDLGLAPLLVDSSANGGHHVFVLLDRFRPQADAHRLARWLARDRERFGRFSVDLFPRGPRLTAKRCGHWLRLPGRHHKRPFWSRVYDPRRNEWLEDEDAVAVVLAARPSGADPAALVPTDFEEEARTGASRPAHTPRPFAGTGRDCDAGRDVRLAREALAYLGDNYYDEYDPWLRVGMALHGLGDEGLELWSDLSAQSGKFDEAAIRAKWASFGDRAGRPGAIGLGSLFFWARQESWPGPGSELQYDPISRVRRRLGARRSIISIAAVPVGAGGGPRP
jgi:hypothetical protein